IQEAADIVQKGFVQRIRPPERKRQPVANDGVAFKHPFQLLRIFAARRHPVLRCNLEEIDCRRQRRPESRLYLGNKLALQSQAGTLDDPGLPHTVLTYFFSAPHLPAPHLPSVSTLPSGFIS